MNAEPGIPAQIDDYRILHRIGHGGQGSVFRAEDPHGTPVALKVIHDELSKDPDHRRRFLREVELARRVAPFCTARVLDVGVLGDRPYIVSEFVPGTSLHHVVQKEGPRSGGGLERLAVATATALAAIHRAGIVHRDFKPSNVLMGPEGPVVIDFGISRALDHTATMSGSIGTPGYMAPEQIENGEVTPAADVFAWAATMVFAATGKRAFPGDTVPQLINAIMNRPPVLTGVPSGLRPLIEQALNKNPALRPTAAELVKNLTGDEFHVETAPLPPTPPPPPVKKSRRPAWLAAALAVVVAGGVLTWQFWPDADDSATGEGTKITTSLTPAPVTFGKPVGDPIEVQENDVRAVALTEIGGRTVVVSGGDDNTVRVTDLNTREELYAMPGHEKWVRGVATGNLDGAEIAVTAGDDGTVRLWDLRKGTQWSNSMLGHDGGVKCVALGTVDGALVAVAGGEDGTIRVWDIHSGEQVGEPMTGHEGTVWGVGLAEVDGAPVVVSTGDDKTVRVWDLSTRQQIGEPMTGHEGWARSVAIGTLDGKPIAITGGSDKTARIWDLTTRTSIGSPLTGHTSWIWSVAFAEIGGKPVVVTASEDKTVRVWDLTTSTEIGAPLEGHTDRVWTVAVGTVAGKQVAVSGGRDETIRMWDLQPPLPG
ncbi:WD40 repeat domain-containing serine/threonine protein kinase [Herbidospora mongoliensis]|uniref:WD40 repeat domain-containing serine/threonine protein kinase n=1 Tax=Herbidospora mongoliensis TaxID=688067 RepID=UPI001471607B|nr:serine/threonine-protein kinase [Herbidospora mongoliensis]